MRRLDPGMAHIRYVAASVEMGRKGPWISVGHFLREEFSSVVTSPVLHQLDKSQLINALQSNFLQASELEVLQTVLKWGEHELIRRMEDREPNLLSHTAHSVTRKGIKKRDLSDIELREILSDLLPLVRMDHVLPPNSEVMNQAIRRGLVSTPPSHMIGDERENFRVNAWIRGGKNHGLFVRPRLFMPYYEEVKTLLEDPATSQQIVLFRMRRNRRLLDIPDTLYMVSRLGTDGAPADVVTASLPTPDPNIMLAMSKREQKLRSSPSCQRALSLPLSSRQEISQQIRLRVVREFNFPDGVADLLENTPCYCADEDSNINSTQSTENINHGENHTMDDEDETTPPPSPALQNSAESSGAQTMGLCYDGNLTFPRQQHIPDYSHSVSGSSSSRRYELPALITEGEGMVYGMRSVDNEGASCSESHLSEIMPDVAMATASLGHLQLNEPPESLQLDLGDGSSHGIIGAAGVGMQHSHLLTPQAGTFHNYVRRPTSPSPYVIHPHRRSPASSSYHSIPPRFL